MNKQRCIWEKWGSSRAVRRRLFEESEVPNIKDAEMEEHVEAEPEPIEAPTFTWTSNLSPQSSLCTWTRFQDSLHDLLNDESSEPVLFTRDAPTVMESVEADG